MEVCVWSPNLMERFSCQSFFIILLDPSPVMKSVFIVLWRIKIPKKVRLFARQVLHGHANKMDRILRKTWMGVSVCGICLEQFVVRV